MSSYKFETLSRLIGKKDDQVIYAWCVYVVGTKDQMEQIREIQYTLHPSFPDPVRTVRDPAHCFALQSQGWGGFSMRIKISPVEGEPLRQSYMLGLAPDSWPMGNRLEQFENAGEQKVYAALLEGTTDWRKLSTICRWASLSEADAKRALENLERRRAVRKAYYLSLDNEELWGATLRVGLLPEP